MAIYYLSVKVISRSKNRSAAAAAAYRAGEKIEAAAYRAGKDIHPPATHDYRRKRDVAWSKILAPAGAPAWATDRGQLWNAVQQRETRSNSRLAREVVVALPAELSPEEMRTLVQDFAQQHFAAAGMIADCNIHGAASPNPHAHIMLTTRNITAAGFTTKNRDWNDKKLLSDWRQQWAATCNNHLARAGHAARIDSRTLADQGINRIPQIHLGPHVAAMTKRGIHTNKQRRYDQIDRDNARLAAEHPAKHSHSQGAAQPPAPPPTPTPAPTAEELYAQVQKDTAARLKKRLQLGDRLRAAHKRATTTKRKQSLIARAKRLRAYTQGDAERKICRQLQQRTEPDMFRRLMQLIKQAKRRADKGFGM